MIDLDLLILKLMDLGEACRRCDSEIYAALMGPSGCEVADVGDFEGWDILCDQSGSASYPFMPAADVPLLTEYADPAFELCIAVIPDYAPTICARAAGSLRAIPGETGEQFRGRLARRVILELLRTHRALSRMPAAAA